MRFIILFALSLTIIIISSPLKGQNILKTQKQNDLISHSHKKLAVFDLTGSDHGFGDVVGGINLLEGIKKIWNQEAYFICIVDERAEDQVKTYYNANFSKIKEKYGITFITPREEHLIGTADYVFEPFYAGRPDKRKLDDLPYYSRSKTIVAMDENMHSYDPSVIIHPNFNFAHKPPGLGPDRSGIFDFPSNVQEFKNINNNDKKRIKISNLFSDQLSSIKRILRNRRTKIGFFYGVHNEILKKDPFLGQTVQYINLVKKFKKKNETVFLITPNKIGELIQAGVDSKIILDTSKTETDIPFDGNVYILHTGHISGKQFTSLSYISDFPVLIEGNNSLSDIIRMKKKFLVYRSSWNSPSLLGLIQMDDHFAVDYFRQAYLEKEFIYDDVSFNDSFWMIKRNPNFENIFHNPNFDYESYINAINFNTKLYSNTLADKILYISKLNNLLKSEKENQTLEKIERLVKQVMRNLRDEIFTCALIFNARRQKMINKREYNNLYGKMKCQNISIDIERPLKVFL